MSGFFSDYWIPEDHGSLTQSACQHCIHRKDCPYSRDYLLENSLRCAARQGNAAAHLLTAEAEQLLKTISCTDDACCLWSAGESLERTLFHMLHKETTLMDRLSV